MTLSKVTLPQREILILVLLACVTTPVFWLTNLDREIAGLFYRPDNGASEWPWQKWWLWDFLYRYAPVFTLSIAIGAFLIAVLGYLSPKLISLRRPAIYILLVIALGPGLVVNLIFKDHWGRPRPVHVGEFGGQLNYIPPLEIGDTDDKSFPCGHCSVGYMFFALYFLSRKRKAFYLTITLSLAMLMALTRMTAGGHFISDILWSGYLVFLVAWVLYYGWYVRKSI